MLTVLLSSASIRTVWHRTHLKRFRLRNVQDVLVALFIGHEEVFDPDLPELD